MANFVANQKFPFWSPTKMLIYEVELLKCKEAQIFLAMQTNNQAKINRKEVKISYEVLRKQRNRKIFSLIHSIMALSSTGKKPFWVTN